MLMVALSKVLCHILPTIKSRTYTKPFHPLHRGSFLSFMSHSPNNQDPHLHKTFSPCNYLYFAGILTWFHPSHRGFFQSFMPRSSNNQFPHLHKTFLPL